MSWPDRRDRSAKRAHYNGRTVPDMVGADLGSGRRTTMARVR